MANYAYLRKEFVPLEDANINVMTHASLWTACFEGSGDIGQKKRTSFWCFGCESTIFDYWTPVRSYE